MFGRRPHHRQPSARLAFAEEHVGQGVAELLAREPGHQHRRDLVDPGQQHRRAGVHHHHRARVDGGDAPHQLVLAAGQGQGVAVEALALHLLGGADHHHGRIGLGGQRHRLLQLLLVRGLPGQVELEGQGVELGLAEPAGVLGPVAEHDRDLLAGVELDRHPPLRRAHQGFDRVGAGGELGDGVEGDLVVQRQPQGPEPGAAQQVGPGFGGVQAGVDLDRGDLGDGQVGAEAAEPVEGAGGAVLASADGAVGGQEPHLHPCPAAVGTAKQRHRCDRDPVGAAHPPAVVDLARPCRGRPAGPRPPRRCRAGTPWRCRPRGSARPRRWGRARPPGAGLNGPGAGQVRPRPGVADQHEPGGGALPQLGRDRVLGHGSGGRRRRLDAVQGADPGGQPQQPQHLVVDRRLRHPALADRARPAGRPTGRRGRA